MEKKSIPMIALWLPNHCYLKHTTYYGPQGHPYVLSHGFDVCLYIYIYIYVCVTCASMRS